MACMSSHECQNGFELNVPQCPREDLNKKPCPDQRLPQHKSLDLKSARIRNPHIGS